MIDELLKDPTKVSGWLMAILALAALIRGDLIPKWIYTEKTASCAKLEAQRDRLQEIIIAQAQTTDRALTVAEKIKESK
jgi:hypothetical protein